MPKSGLAVRLLTFALLLCTLSFGAANGTDAAATAQVSAAMESLKQAMIQRDTAALGRLLHEDLTYVHSNGKLETKADVIKAIGAGTSPIQSLDISALKTRVYGNTALMNGKMTLAHSATDIVKLDVLHVWMKTNDGWKLVARQAIRLTN